MVARRYVNFTLFDRTYPGGAFSHYRQKTQLEYADLAEFLIIFTKKVPGNSRFQIEDRSLLHAITAVPTSRLLES